MNTAFINKRVSQQLERESCPIHHQHPIISWDGDKMTAKCCCDKFRQYISTKAEQVLEAVVAEEIQREIEQALRL